MNQNDWKKDPRLNGMDEQKLRYLSELADKAGKTPKDKLMPLLMNMASGNNNMNFNDQETELMVSILTANMNPAQKKQVDMLRELSKKMGRNGRPKKK